MKTKLLILWAVTLVLTVGVYAKMNTITYSCNIPTDASINDLYIAKWNCVSYKAEMIREGNLLYQENKDYSKVKKSISELDVKVKKIDETIKNKIPKSFR